MEKEFGETREVGASCGADGSCTGAEDVVAVVGRVCADKVCGAGTGDEGPLAVEIGEESVRRDMEVSRKVCGGRLEVR